MLSNKYRAKLARSRPSLSFSSHDSTYRNELYGIFPGVDAQRPSILRLQQPSITGVDFISPVILQRDTKCKEAARLSSVRNCPVYWGVSVAYLASMGCNGNFCLPQCSWFLLLTSNFWSIRSYPWIRISAENKPQKTWPISLFIKLLNC